MHPLTESPFGARREQLPVHRYSMGSIVSEELFLTTILPPAYRPACPHFKPASRPLSSFSLRQMRNSSFFTKSEQLNLKYATSTEQANAHAVEHRCCTSLESDRGCLSGVSVACEPIRPFPGTGCWNVEARVMQVRHCLVRPRCTLQMDDSNIDLP